MDEIRQKLRQVGDQWVKSFCPKNTFSDEDQVVVVEELINVILAVLPGMGYYHHKEWKGHMPLEILKEMAKEAGYHTLDEIKEMGYHKTDYSSSIKATLERHANEMGYYRLEELEVDEDQVKRILMNMLHEGATSDLPEKPTIQDLENILNKYEQPNISINPDGGLVANYSYMSIARAIASTPGLIKKREG